MNRKEKIEYYNNFDYPTFINNPKVEAFIGKDYEYFKDLWAKDFVKKKGNALKVMTCFHWTWLGVILGPIVWFSYRKMYAVAWSLIALFATVSFLESYFDFEVGAGAFFGTNLALALLAQNHYFMYVVDFFRKNANLPGHQLDELIATKGGTSMVAPVVIFILTIFSIGISAILGNVAAGNTISFNVWLFD